MININRQIPAKEQTFLYLLTSDVVLHFPLGIERLKKNKELLVKEKIITGKYRDFDDCVKIIEETLPKFIPSVDATEDEIERKLKEMISFLMNKGKTEPETNDGFISWHCGRSLSNNLHRLQFTVKNYWAKLKTNQERK